MEKNIGKTDKIARYVVAAVLLALGIYYGIWWLYVIAGGMALTAFIGYCPPYKLLKMDTTKK